MPHVDRFFRFFLGSAIGNFALTSQHASLLCWYVGHVLQCCVWISWVFIPTGFVG